MVSFRPRLARRRNGRTLAVRILALVLVGGWLASGARAADTNAVISGWLSAQKDLRVWTADFVQTRWLKTLTQPLTATGHVWFAMPNRFRWELGSPARTIALRQEDQMYVIYPRIKRAELYPLGAAAPSEWRQAISLLEAGFPRDRSELEASFHVLALAERSGSWEITLQPSAVFARKMMPEIRIGLATNNFDLTSTELVFADGSRMRTDFTRSVINPKLDPGVFEWKPGPDYKVTQPLSK